MGEIIKILDNCLIKDLRVELNQYTEDKNKLTVHVQNENGRFEMTDDELCCVLSAFLIANFNKRSIKDE